MLTPDVALSGAEKAIDLLEKRGLLGAVVIQACIIAFLMWALYKARNDQMKDYGVFGEKLQALERERGNLAVSMFPLVEGIIALSSAKGLRDAARNARKREDDGDSGGSQGPPNGGTGSEGHGD